MKWKKIITEIDYSSITVDPDYRIVLYPQDVQRIMGQNYRSACNLLNRIKKMFGKPQFQPLTIYEFCHVTGINEKLVKQFIK